MVYLQRWHGWCHIKLQPSRRKSCVHHTTMLHVTSCKATALGACVFSCNMPPALLANDRDLAGATAVTRGWNGYRNKSQPRKLTLEKKILPPLLPGHEPETFRSRVRRSNHWAIPAPDLPSFSLCVVKCAWPPLPFFSFCALWNRYVTSDVVVLCERFAELGLPFLAGRFFALVAILLLRI